MCILIEILSEFTHCHIWSASVTCTLTDQISAISHIAWFYRVISAHIDWLVLVLIFSHWLKYSYAHWLEKIQPVHTLTGKNSASSHIDWKKFSQFTHWLEKIQPVHTLTGKNSASSNIAWFVMAHPCNNRLLLSTLDINYKSHWTLCWINTAIL